MADGMGGMLACVGEWNDAEVGVYTRLVEMAEGMPPCCITDMEELAPDIECACRVPGRESGHGGFDKFAFEGKVEGARVGAVAGPEESAAKSVGGCESCWAKSMRGGKCIG